MKQIILLVFLIWTTGCGQSGLTTTETVSTNQADVKFRVEIVATGLQVPWGFAFLPGGNLLFTERPGRVRLIENGQLKAEPVFVVPDVEPSGESGLMDISLHPQFAQNQFVYLAYAYNRNGQRVKIVRYKYDGQTLLDPKIIVENIPASPNHAGTRARFGPDGKLYVTTGDSTNWNLAQKTDSLAGKTLRLNDDGSIPADNPFVSDQAYRPEIYSIGHRNAQGLAWTSDGLMFQTEHGPSGFEGKGGGADEVNLVERGKNYGWAEIWGKTTRDSMVSPLLDYTPACAPASAMIYKGDKFPAFRGNLFFGCLRGARMIRVVLNGRNVASQENLLEGRLGRIREIGESPDGLIYFSTSNRDGRGSPADDDDKILRIVPVE
jgi:glucose/arabinose dehydrogenase